MHVQFSSSHRLSQHIVDEHVLGEFDGRYLVNRYVRLADRDISPTLKS